MKNWDFKLSRNKELDDIQEKSILFFLEKLDELPQSIVMSVLMSVLTNYIEYSIDTEKHRNATYEIIIDLLKNRAEWQAMDPRYANAPHC